MGPAVERQYLKAHAYGAIGDFTEQVRPLGDATEYTVACLQLGHGMALVAIDFVAPTMPVLKPGRGELRTRNFSYFVAQTARTFTFYVSRTAEP
jgi:hypothetical protein